MSTESHQARQMTDEMHEAAAEPENGKLPPSWKLVGYDTFDGHFYALGGDFPDEYSAVESARDRLKELEREQPSLHSGGQGGIQDQVFVVRPDGTRFRVPG